MLLRLWLNRPQPLTLVLAVMTAAVVAAARRAARLIGRRVPLSSRRHRLSLSIGRPSWSWDQSTDGVAEAGMLAGPNRAGAAIGIVRIGAGAAQAGVVMTGAAQDGMAVGAELDGAAAGVAGSSCRQTAGT